VTIRDLDDAVAVDTRTPLGPVSQQPVELGVLEALWRNGIDLAVTVPCKYIARLIVETEQDPRFTLLYPSREEEEGLASPAADAAPRSALGAEHPSRLGDLRRVERRAHE
jgi:hypothetical protein